MSKKKERFVTVYSERMASKVIFVDRETGVNYLFVQTSRKAGGLTVLLNRDGKPIITPIPKEDEE